MRRCPSLGSVVLTTGLLFTIATSCGHSIKVGASGTDVSSTGGAAPSTSGGSSSGGTSFVEVAPIDTAVGGVPSNTTGDIPTSNMPSEPTRPGYTALPDPSVVTSLLNSMTPEAKIKQLYGVPNPPDRSAEVYRDIERSENAELNNGKTIRGYKYRDAGRGNNLAAGQDDRKSLGKDYSTTFPAPSIRSASWDVDLEMRVGQGIADEVMASKNNMLLAPCMNIIRHPYWGRTQETYSEDMYHTGRMASALTAGIQKHVVACAKHYAANNVENNRSAQNALMDEQTLREIYGRHFEMVVRDGGTGCIMASYNSVNNKKATQNKHLLTDILRGDFGFRGLVLSDWWAMPGDQNTPDTVTAQQVAAEALLAGMDIEVPWALNYSQLGALVNAPNPPITQSDIDKAAARVLEQKFRFNTVYTDSPWGLGTAKTKLQDDSIVNNEENLALAEEAEVKSAVLLSNGTGGTPVLPIKSVGSIAVVGLEVDVKVSSMTEPPFTGTKLKLASQVNVGDRGSSRVNPDPDKCIDPYAGIKAAAASHNIANVTTGTDLDTARAADFVVVVVGLTAGDEGEEYSLDSLGDRNTLSVGDVQEAFVNDVLGLNKPTAIIVESGSIVNLPWLSHSNKNQATIWAGYGGQRQGAAFGKLLFGDANFSGKVPLAWPKEDDLPRFTTGDRATQMGYFFGYRYYDDLAAQGKPVNLVFPFGWGMSYTTFEYSNLTAPGLRTKKGNVVYYTVDVANKGTVDGEEIVMLFVKGPPKPAGITGNRPVKELKRFAKVRVQAGKAVRVTLPLNIQDLRHWEGNETGKWVIDNGDYTVMVGPNASDLKLTAPLNIQD